jgi:hypothetical protein
MNEKDIYARAYKAARAAGIETHRANAIAGKIQAEIHLLVVVSLEEKIKEEVKKNIPPTSSVLRVTTGE